MAFCMNRHSDYDLVNTAASGGGRVAKYSDFLNYIEMASSDKFASLSNRYD